MNQQAIFSPVFAMFMLTAVVWIYMYSRRIPFIQRNDFGPEELLPLEFARLSPPAVSNPSDNLKNLFELPVLFYALSIYLFVTSQVDAVYLGASWLFVAFRVLHSAVHCTINVVLVRFGLYCVSAVALWFAIVRAAISHLGT